METLLRWLNGVAWERVVVALLHSLWQGAILAGAVWVLLRGIPAKRARLRYGIALVGLLGTLIATMATFHLAGDASAGVNRSPIVQRDASPTAQQNLIESISVTEPQAASSPNPGKTRVVDPGRRWAWAASLWLTGMFVMLIRAGWLLVGAGRLLRGCRVIDDVALIRSVEQLRRSMRIRQPVRLAAGAAIQVPAVLGMIVPVVLLPLAVLNEMPVAHLRMILAHELAHVRRHDYLVNFLQLLIEALLFFNPAVWWLSREVRREREACCDALAVTATGSGPDYVRSLAEVLAGLVGTQPALQLTPAVKGEGGLVDRVRRVLAPEHRPQVRLPWYSLIGMSAVVVVLLAGMWRGTKVAVQAAEKLMTPTERVEKMAQLQNQLQPSLLDERPAEFHVLTGTIRTEDGRPVPKTTEGLAMTQSPRDTRVYSLFLDKQGHFSVKVEGRQAEISVKSPGYAPIISDPLKLGPDGKFPTIDLVLGAGFDAVLHVTDQTGKPVPHASVSIAYLRTSDNYNPVHTGDYTTDAQGNIIVHHAADRPAQLKADVHGYEYDVIPIRLRPGTETTAKLAVAKLTSGVITDASTHEPLAGATIALVQQKGFEDRVWNPHSRSYGPPVLARTDDQGRFALDTLREDSTYVLWITAPNHGCELLRGARAGQNGLDCRLGPSRAVSVEIRADADRMPKTISVDNALVLGDMSYSEGVGLPVHVQNGIGTAVLADPLPGSIVEFDAEGQRARVDTNKAVGPARIDLRAQVNPRATREVVLKFTWPRDGAEPRGHVRVVYANPENPSGIFDDLQISNGEARVSVLAPSKFRYSQEGLAGYWIDGSPEIEVPVGNDPFLITIQAHPAGAIHGTVLDENGKPFTKYFYVSLITLSESPQGRPPMLPPFNGNNAAGKYLLSPLPLGGTYRLIAVAAARCAVSDEIAVAADQPIRSVDLKFAAGVTLAGTVVGPNGQPMPGRNVQLEGNLDGNGFATDATSDRQGKFAFEHVDPNAVDYTLSVKPGENTQGITMNHLTVSDQPLEIRLSAGPTAK